MHNAELKTIRESLGLTAQWLADQTGVKLRTVQYWEAGRMPVPDDVSALIKKIDADIKRAVDSAYKQAIKQKVKHTVLLRYRTDKDLWRFRSDMLPLPATCHAALLNRLRQKLTEEDINVDIIFFKVEDYLNWLDDRQDSEAMRAQWAVLQNN